MDEVQGRKTDINIIQGVHGGNYKKSWKKFTISIDRNYTINIGTLF